MYDIGDIYEKDGVYFVVTKLINNNLSKSIPLSRYILLNYIGLTENALIFGLVIHTKFTVKQKRGSSRSSFFKVVNL